MYVHDLWQGEYDPTDDTGGEAGPQTLAVVVIVGTLFSGLLLIGTALAFAVELLTDWPVFVSLAVAAYYPVVDTVLARRGLPPLGSLLFTGTVDRNRTVRNHLVRP